MNHSNFFVKSTSIICILGLTTAQFGCSTGGSLHASRGIAQSRLSGEQISAAYEDLLSPFLSGERQNYAISQIADSLYDMKEDERTQSVALLSQTIKGATLPRLIKKHQVAEGNQPGYFQQLVERNMALGLALDKMEKKEKGWTKTKGAITGAVIGMVLGLAAAAKAFGGLGKAFSNTNGSQNDLGSMLLTFFGTVGGGVAGAAIADLLAKSNSLEELRISLNEEIEAAKRAEKVVEELK